MKYKDLKIGKILHNKKSKKFYLIIGKSKGESMPTSFFLIDEYGKLKWDFYDYIIKRYNMTNETEFIMNLK